jgi:DNA-binding response OmpR family regulator
MVQDVNLPKMDGMGVLPAARSKEKSLPALVLTGRNGIEDRMHALDSGADDCLLKRFRSPNCRRGCGRCCGGIR